MPIIFENQQVNADVRLENGEMVIHFSDPAFVRCEEILIDPERRHIGGLLHEGYHPIGLLPENIDLDDLGRLEQVLLSGIVQNSRQFQLKAPLKLTKGE